MSQNGESAKEFTVLHVEDDAALVKVVQAAFLIFGFKGNMITSPGVEQALDLLARRAQKHEPVNLILVDMQLPDGTGLEVISKVKGDPTWRLTPVIVLSSELAPGTVSAAYALGANCYVSKSPGGIGLFESLRALHTCWLQDTRLLPQAGSDAPVQDALARAVHLRARTADFYLKLARAFDGSAEMDFWLDRSLNEGNLSNLLAFLLPKVAESDLSPSLVERFRRMQAQVHQSLDMAERELQRIPSPRPSEAYRWALDLVEAVDEEVVAEVIGSLFPKGPKATTILKNRAAMQLKEIAHHILERSRDEGLRVTADALRRWAEQLAEVPVSRGGYGQEGIE